MPNEIEQDIMSHFAFRDARAGAAFDVKGFWRLTTPRYALGVPAFEAAMRKLVAAGYVEAKGASYHLTAEGAAHLYGVTEGMEQWAT